MRKIYLITIFIALIFLTTGCYKTSSNIDNYLNTGERIDSSAKDIMPNLDELPKYKDIQYIYTHQTELIFQSDSVALIVNYDDKTYKSEKEKLEEKLWDESEGEIKYLIPEPEFSINSYNFKVVNKKENDNTYFPKYFGMIATSEEKKSIAYLYFYDMDLDYIGTENKIDPMAEFVKYHFKYDF